MRINLAGEEKSQRGRRKSKRQRSRRSRAFETSIRLPQAHEELGRSGSARPAWPWRTIGRSQAPTRRERARRRQQGTGLEATAPSPTLRRIRWRVVLARMPVVLVLTGLIAGIAYASTDAKFFVYDAQIVGARHLEAEAIYDAAGVDEQNIFWIQPQEVARRIGEMEGIRAVGVRCSLPAQVTIDVEEREPIVMWRALTQEKDWWLDEEGVVLPYHGDVRSPETIFVVDSSERHLQVGDLLEPEDMVGSVRQLAAALPEIKVFFFQADRGLSFSHQVNGGEWPVYVGSSEDLPRKIQVVQVLTDYLVTHNIRPRYVDVRWADHPVYGKAQSE